ncbi:MAG: hypothetical protein L6R40_005665 [Gallowayella cf. fulva]|nr:MAG: hypothetical protein L6R40_005665 [Xanthomendoza cf. fulva]
MADPPPSSAAVSAAFPAPPPFYKSFTQSNLAQLSSLQESNPSLTVLDLPPELRNLLPPPPPPSDQHYRTFGEFHENPALPCADTPPKEPPNPHRLLKTTRQLLLAFLDVTHSMAVEPDTWAPKWDAMRALDSEAHAIINEYRPHQARETLIHMMEEQVERCKAEAQGCKDVCERVRKVLDDVESQEASKGSKLQVDGLEPQNTGKMNKAVELETDEKLIWDIIEKEVGGFD